MEDDPDRMIVKEILDELVERICYGKQTFQLKSHHHGILDEASNEHMNSSLTTNEIIDDTQSTQGEIDAQGERRFRRISFDHFVLL